MLEPNVNQFRKEAPQSYIISCKGFDINSKDKAMSADIQIKMHGNTTGPTYQWQWNHITSKTQLLTSNRTTIGRIKESELES